jgi:N-acylethanolamine-hydrolysing acid amidase
MNIFSCSSLNLDVDFQRQGKSIFKTTTWIGYVGVLTGMRMHQGYSVSVNFRHTGGNLSNNLKAALTRYADS